MKQPGQNKYTSLENYLWTIPNEQEELSLSFAEIEEILNGPLPKLAYERLAWWDNNIGAGVSHKNAWLGAGWKVAEADLVGKSVRFIRTHRYPMGNGMIFSYGGSEGEIDPEEDKKSLVGNEIGRLKIREHRKFSAWREKLQPHTQRVLDALLEEDVTPELIKLAQDSPDDEWEHVQFLRMLGGGNPNPFVARILTEMVLDDILYHIEKSEQP